MKEANEGVFVYIQLVHVDAWTDKIGHDRDNFFITQFV